MKLNQAFRTTFMMTALALLCCSCKTRDWVSSVSSITKDAAARTKADPTAVKPLKAVGSTGPLALVAKAKHKSEAKAKRMAPMPPKVSAPEVKDADVACESTAANHKPHPEAPSMVGSNLLVRTTAYCHKEADSLQYGLKNAAGGTLKYTTTVRSAAADWSRFPLGTRFKIHGQPQEYVIDDYGSALVGSNTIDIYKPTVSKMNEWGVRHVPIQIVEWGCFEESREILAGRKHVKHADHVRKMLSDINARYAVENTDSEDVEPRA